MTEVDAQPILGWKAEVTRTLDRKVTAVTWTADPGTSIAPGQFGQFAVRVDGLPDTATLPLPATQTYSGQPGRHMEPTE